jgi:SH3-like domain-containing protein
MGRRVTCVAVRRLQPLITAAGAALLLASCDRLQGPSKEPAIAQAFVGPITLNLRREISPASAPAATAKHGELIDVLQVRRRFVRVRTPRGEQGWTDSRNLLSAAQMDAIGELAKSAARMPSQGQATVFTSLNVHTDPIRNSTSFFQINESTRVDVLAHQLSPRSGGATPAPFQIAKPASAPKKPKREPKDPPPPRPPAPGLPPDWMELSKTNLPPEPPPPVPRPDSGLKRRRKPATPKPQMDDWYLVRAKDGKAGWVLARMVNLAIPDEVAQYSEGARITSYFALGSVQDGDQQKHHWLWTTIRDGQQPYQFDSFRVFTYVVRKHRYETAYIERGVEGYYPVEAKPGAVPKFSLVLRGEDGQLYRKTYVMEGYLVRKIADVPYKKDEQDPGSKVISNIPDADEKEVPPAPSLAERIKNLFRRAGTS